MSLGNCIPGMVKRGEIDPVRGKRMKDLFEELERYYARSMGPEAAAAQASEHTLIQLRQEARLKKRQTLLQISRQREALKEIGRYRGKSSYAAVGALLSDDDLAPYRGGNVETAAFRIEAQMHGRIGDFIERHRTNLLGKPKDPEGLDNVARELHGQATGDARAKAMAEAIGETFETLRQRFNAAGGNIRKLRGFGLPHHHDALRVRSAGKERWIADVLPELDREAMIDSRTGVPFTEPALREVLEGVWETIRTNGLTGEASSAFRGSKMANRRAEHRFLHFKDGDAWLRYNAQYGANDTPFSAIMNHVSGMAKDIATMERLGPNPDATMRLLLDHVDRAGAQSDTTIVSAVLGTSGGRKRVEDLWRYVKGETSVPVVPETALGRGTVATVHGVRNWNVASMLGSAMFSATGDVFTGSLARFAYGMPMTRVLENMAKGFLPRSAADRQLAQRLGAGMQHAARTMQGMARLYGESRGPGWTQQLADSSLRITGLNLWTAKGQEQFVTDMLGALGDVRHLGWDALPDRLREAMERGGIDKFDWQAIRQAEPIRSGGGEYIDHAAIRDPKAADRLMDFVLRGRAAAVIEPTAASQSFVTFGTQGGTFGGEMIRNSIQFKSFAGALIIKMGRMMASLPPGQRAAAAASFVVGMTLFGAAQIQMREIAKGRDPRPMDTREFWLDALLQGGGLGIAGDLFGVFAGDKLDGVGQFVGGPLWSTASDVARGIKTALPKERKDGTVREGNPAKAIARLARRNVPIGSSNWYARAAFERMVVDSFEDWGNPDVDADRARATAFMEARGQEAWWAPGEFTPGRAPDWENVAGGMTPVGNE